MRKKQRILDAGLEAFSANCYEDASLNHIIEQANVSKGTFYHYFADKMALYLDLVELCIHKKSDYINSQLNPGYRFNPDDDFFTMLKKQTMADIGFLRTEPIYYHFAMRITTEEESVKAAVRERHGWRLDGGVADMVEIAYLKGEFDTKYPKGFVKNILSHMTKSYEQLLFPKESEASFDAIEAAIELYFEFLKHGFASER